MSSTSVETEAACQAALDIVAMRHMLEEIGIWYNEPCDKTKSFFGDNPRLFAI